MIKISKRGVVLEKSPLVFEQNGVLNPAVYQSEDKLHMLYRAVEDGNFSSIGYACLIDPLIVDHRLDHPLLFPETEYESHGVEDPRIAKIDDLYYLCYTAYDGTNALAAIASSVDLLHFERKGIVVPQIDYETFKSLTKDLKLNEKYCRYNEKNNHQSHPDKLNLIWDKNLVLFPEKIGGKLTFLHRIKPDIQLFSVESLDELTPKYWEDYLRGLDKHIVLAPKYDHELSYIGGGCPPIKTPHGWLVIYHGVHDTTEGYVYNACAALLDLKNPTIEIARLPYPLISPELSWELRGEVNNVCFPTGTAVFEDTLYIYYGAADERIACATISLDELTKELLINSI
ncbi:MAG: pesticidal protein Cry7Aa [Saprospiraceae bacterium]|nr:pesticidal protein Cry7Aa [Candidatus Vicinibacter affinis]